MKGIFDTHAHLLDERFDADRGEVIAALPERGVSLVLECATDRRDIFGAAELAEKYEHIYAAVGIHPHSASEYGADARSELAELCGRRKVAAIGEIGLDYHYDFSPRDAQKRALEDQLELAESLLLPVVLHCREATQDMMGILGEKGRTSGVMHCFSGSAQTAERLIEMGLYIGFGGSLTFKNAKKAAEVAKIVPLSRILLETDCPYMAPAPLRGTRNRPENIALVAEKLADIRGTEPEEIIAAAMENGKRLFKIS